MVKCALCGKKIKMKQAIKTRSFTYINMFGEEKEIEETLYFCSEEHRKAWVLQDHLMMYFGDLDQVVNHLLELHGWTIEDVKEAIRVLNEIQI